MVESPRARPAWGVAPRLASPCRWPKAGWMTTPPNRSTPGGIRLEKVVGHGRRRRAADRAVSAGQAAGGRLRGRDRLPWRRSAQAAGGRTARSDRARPDDAGYGRLRDAAPYSRAGPYAGHHAD